MKKKVGISISKYLKKAAKNCRANQTARAILLAPTVTHIIQADGPVYVCKMSVADDSQECVKR